MKRLTVAVAAVAALVVASSSMAAQSSRYVWVGASATMPMGDSKDAIKSGYLADVGFGFALPAIAERLDLHVGALIGASDAKVGNGSLDLFAGSIGFGYGLTSGNKFNPYVLGSVGMMQIDNGVTDAESEFMFQGGGGISTQLTPRVGFWIEARYLSAGSGDSKLTMVPIAAGLTFGLGGN